MKRVAFVVQRCGAEVNGGAEKHCLEVARRLQDRWQVEVLTTCALDYRTWADHYPPGLSTSDGVPIRRFPVARPRDPERFDALSHSLRPRVGETSLEEEEAWMRAQGPWSPALLDHLSASRERFDAFFFFTHQYATSYFGLPLVEDRAWLVPTAHDEWPLRLRIWDRFFERPRALLFNTPSEERLLRERFPEAPLPGEVVGVGVSPGGDPDPVRFRERFGLWEPFVLYLGRIDPAKGCDELIDHHRRLRRARPDAPALVLMGRSVMELPDEDGLVATGFVDEATKWDALAACDLVVMPSPYESLSLVLLEAWESARPVLVSAASAVLVEQVRRAQGGLWYAGAAVFERALGRLLDPAIGPLLGRQGRGFVREHYAWDAVLKRYEALLA